MISALIVAHILSGIFALEIGKISYLKCQISHFKGWAPNEPLSCEGWKQINAQKLERIKRMGNFGRGR